MRRVLGIAMVVLLLIAAGLGLANYLRPVPAAVPTIDQASTLTAGTPPAFSWAAGTEDAIGTSALGVLAATASPQPQPTGSVAKVLTALVALQKLPLAVGQQGPTFTVTADQQAEQEQDAAEGQSTVAVTAGETLTEYQVLQGMLLPSGNNLADLLAEQAFGSTAAAVAAMNAAATTLGLSHTHVTDPSGYDPATVSTPGDLVTLGVAALHNPVLAQIVNQQTATLPLVGDVSNVNRVLGQSGIVGIKTGNTVGQNGAFLFAATAPSASGQTIVGAVMGEHPGRRADRRRGSRAAGAGGAPHADPARVGQRRRLPARSLGRLGAGGDGAPAAAGRVRWRAGSGHRAGTPGPRAGRPGSRDRHADRARGRRPADHARLGGGSARRPRLVLATAPPPSADSGP